MWYSGAVVVSNTEIIWVMSLMGITSTNKAELIALTKALELGKDKKLNIYTDSQYAFTTTYIHRTISCQEKKMWNVSQCHKEVCVCVSIYGVCSICMCKSM